MWRGLTTVDRVFNKVLLRVFGSARRGKEWSGQVGSGEVGAVYSGMVSHKRSFRWQHQVVRFGAVRTGSAGQGVERSSPEKRGQEWRGVARQGLTTVDR